jgi:hypothetical protein
LLAGLALGWAVITRPPTGLAHGLVWAAVWAALWFIHRTGAGYHTPDSRRTLARAAMWTVLGLALPAAVFMIYNAHTTGHPLRMAYMVRSPEVHRLGFRSEGPLAYSPLDALNNLAANLATLNFLLLGWAIGSWTALLVWWKRTRLARPEVVIIALVAGQTMIYVLYHYHDLYLGPRFLFETVPFLVLLAAWGLAPTIRRGGSAACLMVAVLALLAVGGQVRGVDYWWPRFSPIVAEQSALERFMRELEPLERPTVVLLRHPYDEMIGRWFPSDRDRPPLYFVLEKNQARARALPELAGFDWIRMDP